MVFTILFLWIPGNNESNIFICKLNTKQRKKPGYNSATGLVGYHRPTIGRLISAERKAAGPGSEMSVFLWVWNGSWGRTASCILWKGGRGLQVSPPSSSARLQPLWGYTSEPFLFLYHSVNKTSSCSGVWLSEMWIPSGNARKWLVWLWIAGICTSGEKVQMVKKTAEQAQDAAPCGNVKHGVSCFRSGKQLHSWKQNNVL